MPGAKQRAVDETGTNVDRDLTDPKRIVILGLWTAVLAVAFTVLLISDTVTATSF